VPGGPSEALRTTGAALLVVDDLVEKQAQAWVRAARRAGVPSASVHDLGLGCLQADLRIDGSVVRSRRLRGPRSLTGVGHAVVDPVYEHMCRRRRGRRLRVLVALGGGSRRALALAIAHAVAAALPAASVRVAGGFTGRAAARRVDNVGWTGPRVGLRRELTWCDVAVVAGGVTLYEACASGVPVVAVPVVPAQVPTVRGLARLGACLGIVGGTTRLRVGRVARAVGAVGRPGPLADRLAARARTVVDGGGARRVAASLRALMEGRR
jgi:spore coat polysaccharide biosynthesis predicted glycosyltransferase SpsG